ncbi:hypothetical protein [Streptomyces sp. NPDC005046]
MLKTLKALVITLLAVAALALPTAGFGGVASAASQQTAETGAVTAVPVYRFVPVRLTCIDFDDPWPDWRDEINLYYGDQVFFDYFPAGHVAYPPPTTFTGVSLKVDMWEMDNGWENSDDLGTIWVTSTDLGQEQTQHFAGNGWDYELVYRVELVP